MIRYPAIKALILAGGKSSRMGEDKGYLIYHGIPQTEYLYQLAENSGLEAFISCRHDQLEQYQKFRCIQDQHEDKGPAAAILTAFMTHPKAAWLVMACDMPWINEESISFLLSKRNPLNMATAFYNAESSKPEPLFAIWEPAAYPVLESNAASGRYSPYRILSENPVELIRDYDKSWVKNLNTPEERNEFRGQFFS